MIERSSAPRHITPTAIAAGLGLADRREICGFLAMLEAAGTIEILKGLATAVQDKLRKPAGPVADQVVLTSAGLFKSTTSDEALRHRLWFELCQALDLPAQLPLSSRKTHVDVAAMGHRVAEVLKPSVLAARHAVDDVDAGRIGKFGRKLRRTLPEKWSGPTDGLSFPDIVVSELKSMMNGLIQAERDGSLDPEVAAAIRKGQAVMASAAVTSGGWAAFATVVASSGFAPYIAAAKLSALIPFVGGPALVSLLAVMSNPFTVVAGVAVLGYGAIHGQSTAVRATAAARISVMLAIRGVEDQDDGIASLVTCFRGLHRISHAELAHLRPEQYREMVNRVRHIEQRLATKLPPAVAAAPGNWGQPLQSDGNNSATDAFLAGALTAGDMLYHTAAIDPAVLAAADFSRTLAIENPLELAIHVSAFVTRGAKIGLRGYTAEQLVMARLIDQGHVVELAASSTMPGFDLVVDGNPVQVKCGENLSLLHEHFAKYPDIPVIADIGLAQMAEVSDAPWAHLVTTVDGFDLDYVRTIVDQSLDAASSLADGVLPLYALIVGGSRAAAKAWKGEISVEDLPAWLVLDLSIRGGLATAGQIGGAFVGLLAIGPAGALILGPVAGVAALFGSGKVHGVVDRAIRTEWHANVMAAATDLQQAMTRALIQQINLLIERRLKLPQTRQNMPPELMTWLDRRMLDDVIWAWENMDESQSVTTQRRAMELLIEASTGDRASTEVMLSRAKLKALISTKPTTASSLSRIGGELGGFVQDRFSKR